MKMLKLELEIIWAFLEGTCELLCSEGKVLPNMFFLLWNYFFLYIQQLYSVFSNVTSIFFFTPQKIGCGYLLCFNYLLDL